MTAQPAPCLLALDTATEHMLLAVVAGSEHHTLEAEGGARASAAILPALQALLRDAGLTMQDLNAIAFGRGPGAFTGLRTSCAVAQGLALGLSLPVLPIDSLLIGAEDARAQHAQANASADENAGESVGGSAGESAGDEADTFDVTVAVDARMAQAYVARYAWTGRRWHTRAEPALWDIADLQSSWCDEPPAAVAGNALVAFADRLVLSAATRRYELNLNRAAALARLALLAWQQGEAVDAALALPLYVRDKVAFTSNEREQQRQARGDAGARTQAQAKEQVQAQAQAPVQAQAQAERAR